MIDRVFRFGNLRDGLDGSFDSKFISDFANQIASQMGNDLNTELLLELNRNISDLANRPINFYINGKDCAQALYNDLKNEENRLNASNSIVLK